MEIIKFENVSKSYDGKTSVIKSLDLSIKEGEFVTMIGASGCGKTTLLKMVNGLIKPSSGTLYIKGKPTESWDMIQLRRSMGYVIQQIGLFPHLTVAKNIAYVLDIMKEDEQVKRQRAAELIKLVDLDESYLDKYPRELSGGQKQRVGVARALAADPDIILMDEPFGAVDEITRKVLQEEILNIHGLLKKTILFVTHDIEEAIKLGSRIILFNEGVIEQNGTKEEMVFKPKTEYVKSFFGLKNFMSYMNVVNVGKYMKEIDMADRKRYVSWQGQYLRDDSPVMEGIKISFDTSEDVIPVKDNSGEVVGTFSFKDIKGLLGADRQVDSR